MRGKNPQNHFAAAADQSKESDREELPSEQEEGDDDELPSSGSEEERELDRQLPDVPFEELQRALADGSLAARPIHAAMTNKSRRENKKRPMEISSKVKPKRFREIIQAPKKIVRDPRFESLCGNLDKEGFRKRYDFLFEVELPSEKEKLQKMIKKSKDPKSVEEMRSHISWIDKQLKSNPRKNVESEILSEHIKKEREAAKLGKKPYYLKKSDIRKTKLMDKYNELKEAGKLDAFIEKRRRKNASKDHRYMPYRRPGDTAA